jgi:hypothetical protein
MRQEWEFQCHESSISVGLSVNISMEMASLVAFREQLHIDMGLRKHGKQS